MKTHYLLLALAGLTFPLGAKPETDSAASDRIQIALLLDTSNSMDGLIDQTRTQLWKVVNTFISCRKNGAAPRVEVALFEYGNNSIPAGTDYVRLVEPLTRDMDELSRELFSLKTNGGEEFCGAVIQRALSDLSWDDSKGTYRVIFVAGNEPFTQGPVDARKICSEALADQVIVNTIHCGDRESGIAGSWNDGADLAGGEFVIIDQNRSVPHVDAPQDEEIARLSLELNKTYLGYGDGWGEAAARQVKADNDAAANFHKGAAVERALCKSSHNYSNEKWDLVDAVRENKVDVAKMEEASLPEAMRKLDQAARVEYVAKAAAKRAEIQARIAELNRERQEFLVAHQKKHAEDAANTLDEALVRTVRQQAVSLGYSFGE